MRPLPGEVCSRAARAWFAILVAVTLGAHGCSREVLDAVRGTGTSNADGGGPDGDGGGGPGLTVWPNETSFTNSDAWLRQHHDELTLMRPRVLLLNFFNDPLWTNDRLMALATQQAALVGDASRYHGYSNPLAPRFMDYQITQFVDLRDKPAPANWSHPSSTQLPVDNSGAFEAARLFTKDYADRFQISDPEQPGHNLLLCELFERGLINEVWMVVGEDPPRGPLMLERKQKYGADGEPLPGQFSPCAGNEQGVCLPASLPCKVTVRMAHLSPVWHPTCDLEIRGLPFESQGTRDAIPYLAMNNPEFVNADFDQRFGVSFSSWYDVCDQRGTTQCVSYPTPTSATGSNPDGTRWTIPNFVQGCGSVRFPPNARFRNDFTSPIMVQSRCEHFRMRDAPDGSDIPDIYSSSKPVNPGPAQPDDLCGAAWQVYLRQSMPGLGNLAYDVKGQRMKNWWPFLFY